MKTIKRQRERGEETTNRGFCQGFWRTDELVAEPSTSALVSSSSSEFSQLEAISRTDADLSLAEELLRYQTALAFSQRADSQLSPPFS